MLNRARAILLSAISSPAWAHGGHGMPGESHWHAIDAAALAVAVGLAVAAAWWLAGRGRK